MTRFMTLFALSLSMLLTSAGNAQNTDVFAVPTGTQPTTIGSSPGKDKPPATGAGSGFVNTRISSSDGRFTLEFKREPNTRYRIVETMDDGYKQVFQTWGRDRVDFLKPRTGRYTYGLEACGETNPYTRCLAVGSPVTVQVQLNTAAIGNGRSQCTAGETCGGADQLQPGQWWNPSKEGHGWDVYWVNDLNGNNSGPNPYELYVIWYTFREDPNHSSEEKGPPKWIPVWLIGKLQESNNTFTGDLHYCQKTYGVVDCETSNSDAGELTISFSPSTTSATFDWTLDNVKFPGFPSSGIDSLQFFGDSLPSTAPGPYSHFNGIWNNWINPSSINRDFNYSEMMREDYRAYVFSFYDNAGHPVWAKNSSANSPSPSLQLGFAKYITEGYSPAWNKPSGYDPENYTVNAGGFLRHFSDVDNGEIYSNLNLPSSRPGSLYLGTSNNYLPLKRTTGVSQIWFDLNGDPTATHCSTYVHGSCELNLGWSLENDDLVNIIDAGGPVPQIISTSSTTTQNFPHSSTVDGNYHIFVMQSQSGVNLAQSSAIRISDDVIAPSLMSFSVSEGTLENKIGEAAPGEFEISWTWSGEGSTWFEIEYQYGSNNDWESLESVDVFQQQQSISIVEIPDQNNNTHAYRIRGCNFSECTAWETTPLLTLSTTSLTVGAVLESFVEDNQFYACINDYYPDADMLPASVVQFIICDSHPGIENLAGLSEFPNIMVLILKGMNLPDISELSCIDVNTGQSCFPDLRWVSFENSVIPDLTSLSGLVGLNGITFYNSQVGDLSSIQSFDFVNLRTIEFQKSTATNFGAFSNLPDLRFLDLSGSNVQSLNSVGGAGNLISLAVQDTQLLDISGISSNGSSLLPSLERLTISPSLQVDLSPLSTITTLEALVSPENAHSEHSYISSLPQLDTLNLGPNVSHLSFLDSQSLSESLVLNGSFIEHDAFSSMSDFTSISAIDISGSSVGVDLQPLLDLLENHINIGGLSFAFDVAGLKCTQQAELKALLDLNGHQFYTYDLNECVGDESVGNGVVQVENLSYEWQSGPQSDQLRLHFTYPESVFNSQTGRPHSFQIVSTLNPTVVIDQIDISQNDEWMSQYQSVWITNSAYMGSDYTIKTCDSSCTQSLSIGVPLAITSDIPAPHWDVSMSNAVNQHPQQHHLDLDDDEYHFELKWAASTHPSVDYYEVIEIAYSGNPPAPGSAVCPTPSTCKSGDIFYSDVPMLTLEKIRGPIYTYAVRACERVRTGNQPDRCSSYSPIQQVHLYHGTPPVPASVSASVNHVGVDNFQLQWTTSLLGYQQLVSSPDFFVYRYSDDNADPSAGAAENGYVLAQNYSSTGWVTGSLSTYGKWDVWACKRDDVTDVNVNPNINQNTGQTVSCSAPTRVTVTASRSLQFSEYIEPSAGTIPLEPGAMPVRTPGGPDDMVPGEWWDPERAGTGWSFFWANNLRHPDRLQELYGNPYDLVAVWYAYRKLEGTDHWSPVWYFSHMKLDEIYNHVGDLIGYNYKGALLYTQSDIDALNVNDTAGEQHINVGELIVHFDASDNTKATVVVDASQAGGAHLEDVHFNLQSFANAGQLSGSCGPWADQPENFIDHYSGFWWNYDTVNGVRQVDERFAIMNWIEKNYESLYVLFYDDPDPSIPDDLGDPIWARGDHGTPDGVCNDLAQLHEPSIDLDVVPYGFDPTALTTSGFWDTNPLVNVGHIGRLYYTDNKRRGEIWGQLNLGSIFGSQRSGGIDFGQYPNATTGSVTSYEKGASFHDVRISQGLVQQAVTECGVNQATAQTCDVYLTWFTDGDYPDAQLFYSKDNLGYIAISDVNNDDIVCGEQDDTDGSYSQENLPCVIKTDGVYQFVLNRDGTVSPDDLSIMHAAELTVRSDSAPGGQVGTNTVPSDSTGNSHGQSFGHDASIGSLPGEGSVSGGAATYTIPIEIPPGRQGMQPVLSLNYSSRSGNGALGVGWSISGLSSIHRCGQTIAQDGQSRSVHYDTSDRLCLNGQRLVPVLGNYWENGSQYRTEIDQFSRVTLNENSGDYSFIVETKSGVEQVYLEPVQATGAPGVSSWLITDQYDQPGNLVSYNYSNYGDGEVLISSINYTGTLAGGPGDRSVVFEYEMGERPDASFAYQSGGKMAMTKRLESITTSAPCAPSRCTGIRTVRQYVLDYELSQIGGVLSSTSIPYTGKSQLESVQVCGFDHSNNSVCKPATEFYWSAGSSVEKPYLFIDPEFSTSALVPEDEFSDIPEADFDLIGLTADLNQGAIELLEDLDGNGVKELRISTLKKVANSSPDWLVLDTSYVVSIDPDFKVVGVQDLLDPETTGLGNENTLASTQPRVDFNNDGRVDLIRIYPDNTIKIDLWSGDGWALTGAGTPFNTIETGIAATKDAIGVVGDRFFIDDFNADGLPDILVERRSSTLDCDTDTDSNETPVYLYLNSVDRRLLDELGTPANPQLTFSSSLFTCLDEVPGFNLFNDSTPVKLAITNVQDLNQDGYPDVSIGFTGRSDSTVPEGVYGKVLFTQMNGNSMQLISRSAQSLGLSGDLPSERFHLLLDINGDGLNDYLFAKRESNENGRWKVKFNNGSEPTSGDLFGPTVDLDSTVGLSCAGINCQGSAERSWRPSYASLLKPMDYDADGRLEILVPKFDSLIKYCIKTTAATRAAVRSSRNPDPDGIACGRNVITETPFQDRSINEYDVLKLSATSADNDHQFDLITETGIVGTSDSITGDLNGDGLDDLISKVGVRFAAHDYYSFNGDGLCYELDLNQSGNERYLNMCRMICEQGNSWTGNITDPNDPDYQYRNSCGSPVFFQQYGTAFASLNQGAVSTSNPTRLPEMLIKAIDGLGNESNWTHYPLTSSAGRTTGMPLYLIPDRSQDGYVDGDSFNEYFYFTSTMYVVGEHSVSNGVGGQNLTEYGYEEAVFNNSGRGFQGFRKVSSEQHYGGSTDESIRSISVFHQMFPLAGQLQDSYSQLAEFSYLPGDGPPGSVLNHTQYNWGCRSPSGVVIPDCDIYSGDLNLQLIASTQGSDGASFIFQPVAESMISNSNDPDQHTHQLNELVTRVTTENVFDAYGNQTELTKSQYDVGLATTWSNVTSTYEADTASWWLNKRLKDTTQSNMIYDAAMPAMPSIPSPATLKIMTKVYGYDGGTLRSPDCVYSVGGHAGTVQGCSAGINSVGYGTKVAFTYNQTFGNLTGSISTASQSTLNPRSTLIGYDAGGYFPTSTTNALSHSTLREIDPGWGVPLWSRAENGLHVGFVYDHFGNLTRRFHPDSLVAAKNPGQFDGNLASHYAPRSGTYTTRQSTICPNLATIFQANYCQIVAVDGAPLTTAYMDSFGRPVRSVTTTMTDEADNPRTIKVTQSYTARGLTASESIPSHSEFAPVKGYQYDRFGRTTRQSTPRAGQPTQYNHYRYDGLDTFIKVSQSESEPSPLSCTPSNMTELCMNRTYLSGGQLYQTTDAHQGQTSFWFDGHGNPLMIRDAMGHLTGASYNDLKQRGYLNDPNMGDWSFSYNGYGELKSQTDANLHQVTFEYDKLGRQVARNALGGTNGDLFDSWTYDSTQVGSLATQTRQMISDGNSWFAFARGYSYDERNGQLITQTTTIKPFHDQIEEVFTINYQHDQYFARPLSVSYPHSLQTRYEYDDNGMITAEYDAGNNTLLRRVEALTPTGEVALEVFGNGLEQRYDHDSNTWQMLNTQVTDATSTLLSIDYGYDQFGNVNYQSVEQDFGLVNGTYHETYQYDKLHRLTSSDRDLDGNLETIGYSYDAMGNLKSKSDFAVNYNYSNDSGNTWKPNAVKSVLLEDGVTTKTFDYDGNGNLTDATFVVDDFSRRNMSVQYDAYNKPVCMARGEEDCAVEGGDSLFWYGSDQSRYYQQRRDGGATLYVDKLYEEIDGITEKFYIGDYAYWSIGGDDSGLYFLHKDRLGSVQFISDAQGQAVAESVRGYDPFGKPRELDGTDSEDGLNRDDLTTRGFTQHEHLNELELIHMNGRAYDYNLGRFLSVDPLIQSPENSQSLNPYSYIMNNPLSGTDPSGYASESAIPSCHKYNNCEQRAGSAMMAFAARRLESNGGDSRQTENRAGSGESGNVISEIGSEKSGFFAYILPSGMEGPSKDNLSSAQRLVGKIGEDSEPGLIIDPDLTGDDRVLAQAQANTEMYIGIDKLAKDKKTHVILTVRDSYQSQFVPFDIDEAVGGAGSGGILFISRKTADSIVEMRIIAGDSEIQAEGNIGLDELFFHEGVHARRSLEGSMISGLFNRQSIRPNTAKMPFEEWKAISETNEFRKSRHAGGLLLIRTGHNCIANCDR